ncbi:hypothetical protein PROFUN_08901 [Planoprotostelium fungivorum]|uniref:G8 domain-containing protein n=1 Tax=Planoprotostelium fungivorum TaxID=1890364 RepID=A0A2P6NIT9_9EUKA|nr:hypothetical protein PROFUN_08901 [Planoprotostelium fungivorum]
MSRGHLAFLLLFIVGGACALAACPPSLPSGTIKWSTRSDWNQLNGDATISAGTTAVLDSSPQNSLGVIHVNGVLYILDATLSIVTQGIVVGTNGTLYIGTKDCPVTKKVTITLVGGKALGTDPYDSTDFGVKGLVSMMGGTVQMFGYTAGPSWTRLTSNAMNSSSSLQLQDAVQWRTGDTILIASTDFTEVKGKFPDQHETIVIQGVSSDGKTVTLSTPLSFTHWGQGYQRAEVGRDFLLTKRIVIQGDNASDSNSQGGHIMLRYGYHIVQAVELTRMGQSGVMGRYPLHFHLARFMFGMNVVRCVSVHETHGITLQDNIGYNTFGHCWFLEDGGEHGNQFIRNWGARIQNMAQPLLVSDSQASAFWVSNPNNTFIDNVASGSFIGFWFVMPVKPLRKSAVFWPDPKVMSPQRTSLPPNGFHGKVIHTIYQDGVQCSGFEADDAGNIGSGSWQPTTGPPFSDNMKIPLVLSDMIVYKIRGSAIWSSGCAPATWKNIVVADFGRGIDVINGQAAVNWTFIGRSDNKGLPNTKQGISVPDPNGGITPIGGVTHYDVGNGLTVVDSTFINFTDPNVPYGAWSGSGNGPGWDSPPGWMALNSTLINSEVVAFPSWFNTYTFHADGILDDGTMTGVKGGAFILGAMPGFGKMPECTYKDSWPGYQCNWFKYGLSHMVVSADVNVSPWIPEKSDPTQYQMDYVGGKVIVNLFSNWIVGFVPMGTPITNYVYTAFMNGGHYEIVNFNTTGSIFQSFGSLTLTMGQCTKANGWVIFSIAYPKGTTLTVVTSYNTANTPAVQHKQVNAYEDLSWNTYYYDSSLEKLYILLSSDTEQQYGYRGGGDYYYKSPYSQGQKTMVTASCGTNCRRSGKATIAPQPAALPKAVRHDFFRADLLGPKDAAGTAFFQLYPSYRNLAPRLAYQLYHNLRGLDYNFCLAVNNECVSELLREKILGVSFVIPLTRRLWEMVNAGGLQLMATSSVTGDILLSGEVKMQDTDGKTWAPADSSAVPACKPSYETIPVYNGSSLVGLYGDSIIIKNDTSSPMCDGQSLTFINSNYNSFGFTDMASKLPDRFVSVEFFAKSTAPDTTIILQVTSQGYWGSANNPQLIQSYSPNYFVDDEWTFVRLPTAGFNFNNSFHRLSFGPAVDNEFDVYGQNYFNLSLSQVRFSTVPAQLYAGTAKEIAYTYASPATSGVQQTSTLVQEGLKANRASSVEALSLCVIFAALALI